MESEKKTHRTFGPGLKLHFIDKAREVLLSPLSNRIKQNLLSLGACGSL